MRAAELHAAVAEANRQRLAAVREAKAARIDQVRAERDAARPVVAALLKRIGPVPSAEDRDAGARWVQAARTTLSERLQGVRPLLAKQMAQAGWSDAMIDKAAEFMISGPARTLTAR